MSPGCIAVLRHWTHLPRIPFLRMSRSFDTNLESRTLFFRESRFLHLSLCQMRRINSSDRVWHSAMGHSDAEINMTILSPSDIGSTHTCRRKAGEEKRRCRVPVDPSSSAESDKTGHVHFLRSDEEQKGKCH